MQLQGSGHEKWLIFNNKNGLVGNVANDVACHSHQHVGVLGVGQGVL